MGGWVGGGIEGGGVEGRKVEQIYIQILHAYILHKRQSPNKLWPGVGAASMFMWKTTGLSLKVGQGIRTPSER